MHHAHNLILPDTEFRASDLIVTFVTRAENSGMRSGSSGFATGSSETVFASGSSRRDSRETPCYYWWLLQSRWTSTAPRNGGSSQQHPSATDYNRTMRSARDAEHESGEGRTLHALIALKGPLPMGDAIRFTLQIAEDLASRSGAANQYVHPQNIVVTADGHAELVDPVWRELLFEGANAATFATFDYISPEQARDPRDVDVRSNLYSLGCTLFYMLTGLPPFPDGTVLQKLLCHSSEPPPDLRHLRSDVPARDCSDRIHVDGEAARRTISNANGADS